MKGRTNVLIALKHFQSQIIYLGKGFSRPDALLVHEKVLHCRTHFEHVKDRNIEFNNHSYLTFTETIILRRNTWSVIDKGFMAFSVANYGQKLLKSAASSLPKTNVNSDTYTTPHLRIYDSVTLTFEKLVQLSKVCKLAPIHSTFAYISSKLKPFVQMSVSCH